MIECHLDTYPVVYLTAIRIAAVITLPINVFGLYCVYAKTPTHMKEARLVLWTYQIFNTLSDFLYNVIMEPVMVFPLPFGRPHGLMRLIDPDINVGVLVCLAASVTTCSSFLQTFHFRLNYVLPNNSIFKFRSKWKFIATRTFYYLLFDGALIAAYFIFKGDLVEQIQSLLTTYSCAADLLTSSEVKMLDWFKMKSIFYVFMVEMSSIIILSLIMMSLSYYYLNDLPVSSEKTRRLQKEFQLSLFLQAFIPLVVLLIPGCAFNILIISGHLGIQTFCNIIILLSSMLGCQGTVVMFLFNGHYRRYVIHLFTRKRSPVHNESST